MPTSCEFQLERANAVYYSGEEIKGSIIIRTQNNIQLNAILITLEGEVMSKWNVSENDSSSSTDYHEKQQFLLYRNKVFDGTTFLAGEHVYTVSMFIPYHCPSTCKGLFGHISYEILVRMKRSLKFDNVFRRHITVYEQLDLNYNPECQLSAKGYNIKYLCRWPCRSGPILSSLAIPYRGYIPEQSISFVINIDNQSQYDIAGMESSLLQHFTFWSRKSLQHKYYTKTLAKTVINKRTLRLSKRIYEDSIVVPPNTQRSTLCKDFLISLDYELKVNLKIGLLHKDIEISIPIIIGTVPLQRHSVNTLVTMQPTASTSESRNQSGSIQIPGYSFPNSNILQTTDNSQHASDEGQRIYVNLPQFPVYDIFADRTQAENSVSNPDWD